MSNLETLYSTYFKKVYKYAQSKSFTDELAFDITQDTFLQANKQDATLKTLNEEETLNWLLALMDEVADDYQLEKVKKLDYADLDEGLTNDSEGDPLTVIKSEQIRNLISESIDSLKAEHKQAITLFDIRQLTYKECAAILGISDVAFSSLLRRARKSLIAEMIKRSAPNTERDQLTDRELMKIVYWFDLLDIPSNLEEEVVSKSRTFFNGLKDNYEITRATVYPEKINEFLISTVNLKESDIVADLGSGTGDLSFKINNLVKKVYAVDHSVEILNMLKKNIKDKGTRNIEPVLAEIGPDFVFPNELINVAFCTMVLHHVFDPVACLKRLNEIIVPGGELVIADISYTNENWKFKESHDFWSGFKLEQIQKWLERTGFKVIHLEENYEHSFNFEDTHNGDKRIEVPLMYARAIKK